MKLNRNGFAIGMVLIIVFILMMAGATFLFRMQGGVTSISVIEKSTKATYLAEAGINLASSYLRSYGICFESGITLPERSLDGGTFNTAMSRKTPNSTLVTILSSGSYSGTSKVIMVQALCMPASTTVPVILTQKFNEFESFADYSPEKFLFPDAAHASPLGVSLPGKAVNYPSQMVYFRVAEDNELEKIISPGGKKNTAGDMLRLMLPVIEGERRFFMENSASSAADKKYSNIYGHKIKIPAEPGSVETAITAGSKADKAQNMADIMETIDRIVAATLYSKLWTEDSMNVELFRESFGDACDVYAACGNHLIKSGQPFSAISNHIIFSGLPGMPITSYNSARNTIENAMPALLVYDTQKPPDFNGAGQGAALTGAAANNAPVRRQTAKDKDPVLSAGTAAQLEEKLAAKIENIPEVADVVNKHIKDREKEGDKDGQKGEGNFRVARNERHNRNSGGNNGGSGNNGGGNNGGGNNGGSGNNNGPGGGNNGGGDHHDGERSGDRDGGGHGGGNQGGGIENGPGRRN